MFRNESFSDKNVCSNWRGRGIGEAEADIDEMKGKLTLGTNVSKLKCLR